MVLHALSCPSSLQFISPGASFQEGAADAGSVELWLAPKGRVCSSFEDLVWDDAKKAAAAAATDVDDADTRTLVDIGNHVDSTDRTDGGGGVGGGGTNEEDSNPGNSPSVESSNGDNAGGNGTAAVDGANANAAATAGGDGAGGAMEHTASAASEPSSAARVTSVRHLPGLGIRTSQYDNSVFPQPT